MEKEKENPGLVNGRQYVQKRERKLEEVPKYARRLV